MKNGICKLCLELKPLVKAHIYPQFMYEQSMFDEKNRMILVKEKEFLKNETFNQQQSGFWDGNILCAQCDNEIISGYENYGKFLNYGGNANKINKKPTYTIAADNPDFTFIKFQNVDYSKYKCFLLSLVWRASVSNLETFKSINLGREHNERIRNYLLSSDPGPDDHYEIIVGSIRVADYSLKDIVTNGISYRTSNGGRIVSLFIGGLGYFFSIGAMGHKFPELFQQCTPNKNNETSIISFKSTRGRNIILRMSGLDTFTKV